MEDLSLQVVNFSFIDVCNHRDLTYEEMCREAC